MRLRRSRTAKRGRIEIIPMIDVMFFLLATFMLTSLSMQRLDAIRLTLPQGHAEALASEQPLTLAIARDGHIEIDRQRVSLDDVAATIRRLVGPRGDVVIAADQAAANGIVVQAMLRARDGGAEHFLVAVQRDQ
ncbi:biopolymer transporter ExbD [Paraburkholderia sp. SARCC-3016]|jgi:biopolymer transport protein ExbD|uniref:ExbD/TolR family protein n=1 Tax=Paraburkholderia sp. SARCC-3016 TaxID=3058611 RepID=UPI002808F2DF|nr:biopolymer transporter ExbD [Paraburkholderia sp. SARCC-3016]MDQ7979388.1 biopolymer transporter ExbD [Paraburkholderia sp. SARCC-3016]